MTAADRRGASAVAAPSTRRTDLGIDELTVRGRGLSPTTGRRLATAVALALAGQLPAGARIAAFAVV